MNRSETTAALATALAKAQGTMRAAELDRKNPFFNSKYATLASIWEAIRKPLSENELAVSQVTYPDNEHLILETVLLHSSGEWISAQLVVKPVKDDPQGVGSAISYARRYGLSAIVGAVSDEDDDGSQASQGKKESEHKPIPAKTVPAPMTAKAPAPAPQEWEDLTPAQKERVTPASTHWIDDSAVRKGFWSWCNQHDLSNEDVHIALNVKHLNEYPGTKDQAKGILLTYYQKRVDNGERELFTEEAAA